MKSMMRFSWPYFIFLVLFAFILIAAPGYSASGQEAPSAEEQARQLFNRLTGVPASPSILAQMTAEIENGNYKAAASIAASDWHFLNNRIKNSFAKPMSNLLEANNVQFNDAAAMIVGFVRDNRNAKELLYEDVIYRSDDERVGRDFSMDGGNLDYFVRLEDRLNPTEEGMDLGSTDHLFAVTQSEFYGSNYKDLSGIITSNFYGREMLDAGTNRRATRGTLKHFLCSDIFDLRDSSQPMARIRQDVDRAPTGEPMVFLDTCKTCHSMLDAASGAFAYFNYSGNMVRYREGQVEFKMIRNSEVFEDGFRTFDDSWVNFFNGPSNQFIGWKDGSSNGKGVQSWGKALANTDQFAKCMARRAFTLTCQRAPSTEKDLADLTVLSNEFIAEGYKLRDLILKSAILPQCIGTEI